MKIPNLMLLVIHACLLMISKNQSVLSQETEASDANACENYNNTLPVLPGLGWDSLQGKTMSRILMLNYSRCKTTHDGLYLIPDRVHSVQVNDTLLLTQYLDDWRNYKSIVTKHFQTTTQPTLLDISFIDSVQRIKQRQLQDTLASMFVQMRITLYKIELEHSAEMTPLFKTLMLNAAQALLANDTRMAEYILEYVVRDYGTHFVTALDIGGILLTEDVLSKEDISQKKLNKNELNLLAKSSFLNTFKIHHYDNDGYMNPSQTDLNLYESIKKVTSINTTGGADFDNIHKWQHSVPFNPAVISYKGDPLHYLITSSAFPPGIPHDIIDTLRIKLSEIVKTYYILNTHKGCTDVHDHNFDYSANMDDGSCGRPSHKYIFGGMYQICWDKKTESLHLCSKYNLVKRNPLTNHLSCPNNYFSVELSDLRIYEQTSTQKCWETCTGWIFKDCRTHCRSTYYDNESYFTTYWCASLRTNHSGGYLFGGIYSPWTDNIVTNKKSCPANFGSFQMWQACTICVSTDYGIAHKTSAAFGGFYSNSNNGNPMAASDSSFSVTGPFPNRCPPGYVSNTAIVSSSNPYFYIFYCIKAKATPDSPQLVRPPYTNSSEDDYMSMVNESMGFKGRESHDSEMTLISIDEIFENDTEIMSLCISNLSVENDTDIAKEIPFNLNISCKNDSIQLNLENMNETENNKTNIMPETIGGNETEVSLKNGNSTQEILDIKNGLEKNSTSNTKGRVRYKVKFKIESKNGTIRFNVSEGQIVGLRGNKENETLRFIIKYENGTILTCSNNEYETEILCLESENGTAEAEFNENGTDFTADNEDFYTETYDGTYPTMTAATKNEVAEGRIDENEEKSNKQVLIGVGVTILCVGAIGAFVFYRFRKIRLPKVDKSLMYLTPI